MEVDNELINELIQNTESLVELTDEQRETLKQSFSMIVGTYLITKNKTNVVILGDDFNVDLVKSFMSKHQKGLIVVPPSNDHFNGEELEPPVIGCVGNVGFCQPSDLSLSRVTEDNTTIKLINTRLDFDVNYCGDSLTKPHPHSHRKRNKFKPNKISHKRRK